MPNAGGSASSHLRVSPQRYELTRVYGGRPNYVEDCAQKKARHCRAILGSQGRKKLL
jgi:hypothetical protein